MTEQVVRRRSQAKSSAFINRLRGVAVSSWTSSSCSSSWSSSRTCSSPLVVEEFQSLRALRAMREVPLWPHGLRCGAVQLMTDIGSLGILTNWVPARVGHDNRDKKTQLLPAVILGPLPKASMAAFFRASLHLQRRWCPGVALFPVELVCFSSP